MTDNAAAIDDADLIYRYRAGETEAGLARHYGVCRRTIHRRLILNGVERHTKGDLQRRLAAQKTPEERARGAAAAHQARRGQKDTLETLCQRAKTRQERGLGVSPSELLLFEWLKQRGIESIPQQAIGPYNADLGAAPVAVEIHGGCFHATGRHLERVPARCSYLLNEGWNLVIVWVDKRRGASLKPLAADYIAAFIQESRRDPALRGQYRVIWGDGQVPPLTGFDLDDLTRIPPRR